MAKHVLGGAQITDDQPLAIGGGTLGETTDAEAVDNGTLIGVMKRIRTILGGQAAVGNPDYWPSGDVTDPAANVLIVDTGPMVAGSYRIESEAGFSDVLAAGKGLIMQHRNAADTATLHSVLISPAGTSARVLMSRIPIALNERVRIINAAAGAPGSRAAANIRAYKIA